MFKRFVSAFQMFAAVAAAATVVLLGTVSPTVAKVETPDLAAGTELFQSSCAGCHGPGGEGGVGPALAGGISRFGSDEEVATFVATGVPGRMPGFETRLGPDEINAITEYVWTDLAGSLALIGAASPAPILG